MKKPASRSAAPGAAARAREGRNAPADDRTRPPLLTPAGAVLGGCGLAAIVAGFVLLSQGSITLAPLLLVAGYAVLIPLAILR